MHPNVFMELSSELQVMCHLSKVQLRNFWTWIPMILRIFFGNKGTVLPFSYWICLRLFLGGSSAADFKSAQLEAFNGTCDFSSSNFFSFFFWLIWICMRIHLEEYHEPVFLHCNRFIRYTVIFFVHTWNTEDSEGESLKKPGTFLLYLDSVLV